MHYHLIPYPQLIFVRYNQDFKHNIQIRHPSISAEKELVPNDENAMNAIFIHNTKTLSFVANQAAHLIGVQMLQVTYKQVTRGRQDGSEICSHNLTNKKSSYLSDSRCSFLR
jgi:hypothetical protein